jgi:hypothetical protein
LDGVREYGTLVQSGQNKCQPKEVGKKVKINNELALKLRACIAFLFCCSTYKIDKFTFTTPQNLNIVPP